MVMTIHPLHGGDGYAYLTRQVAAHDNTVAVGSGTRLTDYYTVSGEPPGIWAGKGCDALGVSGVVREDQMASLFGEGLHPDADRRPGMDNRLGRRAPKYKGNSEFRKAFDAAVESFRLTHGRGVTLDERAAVRTAVATRILSEREPGVTLTPARVRDFAAAALGGDRQAVDGYDLTFSPVKSISTLWAVGTPEQREQVELAHEDAWRETLAWIEREVAFTRTGAGGVAQIETRGLVVTAYEHRASRAGDPDLHTHMVVANKVQGVDGVWRSLDGRVVHAATLAASAMYDSRVEANVTARLGVAFAPEEHSGCKNPVREIIGVPRELNEAFSRRRAAIVDRHKTLIADYRSTHGRAPSAAVQADLAQQATLETREPKGLHRPLAERVAQWRAVSERVLGAGAFEDAMSAAATVTVEQDSRTPEQIARESLAALSGKHSTFTRWHIRAEIERQVRGNPARDLTALADRVESLLIGGGGDAIRLTVDGEPVTREQQRSNGESVYRVHGAERFTAQPVLDAEQRLIEACRICTAHRAQVPGDVVADLDAGQRELVARFVGSGLLLVPAVGAPGVGKTTAMRAVVQAWQLNGGRVIAMANAASAAKTLGDEVGIRAQTIAKVITLHRLGLLTDEHVTAGDMLLVDEAGSAGTLDLDALRGIAVERGAVIRMVGDWRQSGSVAAGGALRLLANELGAAEMLEVHRFTDPAERSASLALRSGDTAAVDFYLGAGRVHETTDLDQVERTYQAWKADIAAGRTSLMMAKSNDTVDRLNTLAHGDLFPAGRVGESVDLRGGQWAQVGDTVLSRKNDTRIPVGARGNHALNGQLWNVKAVNADGSLRVQLADGKAVTTLPARYVAEHVELGYAATIDRAKGSTVDTGHAVVDPGMNREDLVVAVTRGRESNHVYVPVEYHLDVDVEHPAETPTTGGDVLVGIVEREGAELSATEVMREEMDAPGRLDVMVPEYADTVERVGKTAVVARSEHVLPRVDPPLPWLLPVPQVPADDLVLNARGRAQSIADRAAELGNRVDVERPSWARPLGARPVEPVPARSWDRAATFAAAYREQFGIDDADQVLGERVDTGTRGKAWQAADDAVRTVCPRRFSEVSDRKLAAKIAGWQRVQKDAASAKKDLEKIRTQPGTFVTKAERENAADRAGAQYARSMQAVKAMREEIKREAQVLRDREAELAATGRFAGGKRKALGGEIAALKAAQEARISSLTDAEANLGPSVPRVFPDSSEAAVEARCEQRLAAAQARDAKTMAGAVAHAERTAAAAAASRDSLSEALDEQAYRERNGMEVADDPAVLEREQAQREQAQQAQRQQEMERSARMNETIAAVQVEGFGMG